MSRDFFVFLIEKWSIPVCRVDLGISTTSLAGGLLCGYKPLFPACL